MIQTVNLLTKDDQIQIQTKAHHTSYEGKAIAESVAAKWVGVGRDCGC